MDDADRASLVRGLGRALRRPWQLNQAGRLSVDAFAQRYASGHGLTYQPTGQTPPATWFLQTVDPEKSHSFLNGAIASGPSGVLFYAEKPIRKRRGATQGWTVALYRLPEVAELAYGIACVWRRPEAVWGGRVKLASALPPDTIEIAVGDATLDERYLTAISRKTDTPAIDRLFTADFIAWMSRLPWHKAGDEVIRFELRNGTLCVYIRGKLRSTEAVDGFAERAAQIAERVRSAAHPPHVGPGRD